jgi:hypothetical protein
MKRRFASSFRKRGGQSVGSDGQLWQQSDILDCTLLLASRISFFFLGLLRITYDGEIIVLYILTFTILDSLLKTKIPFYVVNLSFMLISRHGCVPIILSIYL